MDERRLGRAVALVALHTVADREEAEAEAQRRNEERQRKAEEAEERRRRREETSARRAQEMRRLGFALRREGFLVLGWSAILLPVLLLCSIGLTFGQHGASAGASLAAAWNRLWMPVAISAGIAWTAGLCFDVAQAGLGRPAWSSPVLPVHPIMGVAAPGVLVGAAVESSYVSPFIWEYAAYASAAGFAVSLLARFLWQAREDHRTRAQFAGVTLCTAVVVAAWFLSTTDQLPSSASQARLDRRLARHAPMGNCRGVPLKSLPPGLLKDSLDGMVRCRRSGRTGRFYAFASTDLFDVYVSQRKSAVGKRADRSSVQNCPGAGGAYTSDWWHESAPNRHLGDLLCYGAGRGSTIEWSDNRSDAFASVRGRGRGRLYRWWRHSEVVPGFGV